MTNIPTVGGASEIDFHLLDWLREDGQYGECHGKALDVLIAKGLAVVEGEESGLNNGFIAKGTDIMYRRVSLTEAGRALLTQGDKISGQD
jgi:hypothetical protein